MKKELQKKANQILKQYPEQNRVLFTQDEQAFFNQSDAKAHQRAMGYETEIQEFFREGFEPQDTDNLQEDFEEAVLEIEQKDALLSTISSVVDLETEKPNVEKDTPDVVVAVIELREKYEQLLKEKEKLTAELEQLKTKKNGETKTNSKKA